MDRAGVRRQVPLMPCCAAPVRYRPWVTLLCAALLTSMMAYLFVLSRGDDLASLRFPGESAGRMLDRHLDFYEGYASVPAWQRGFFALLFGSRAQVQATAVRAYREVLRYFHDHPAEATPWAEFNTRARLLVLLAETGRHRALERELSGLGRTLDEEMVRDAVRYAYTDDPVNATLPEVFYGARLLPLGWAGDRLDLRLAQKLHRDRQAQVIEQRLRQRGARWRDRVMMLAAAVALLVGGGLWAWTRRRGLQRPAAWRGAALDQPWSLGEGFAVVVRVGLLGVAISAALHLLAGPFFRPGVLALWSTLFASLPMVWLIHRNLLKPRGLSFASAFGLTLNGVSLGRLGRIALAMLAAEWCGTLLIAWLGWKFGLNAHWSEGLYEQEIFGSWQTAALSGINLVLWAPLFEEVGFRGLIYTSLRSRLSPRTAIVASALLFSALHLYSWLGFLSVLWSGVVLAYAYERFRSLLPGMIVHGVGNLLALNTVLLFYR